MSGCKADDIKRENYLSNFFGELSHNIWAGPQGPKMPRDTASVLQFVGHPGVLGERPSW